VGQFILQFPPQY